MANISKLRLFIIPLVLLSACKSQSGLQSGASMPSAAVATSPTTGTPASSAPVGSSPAVNPPQISLAAQQMTSTFKDNRSPCLQFRLACMAAGFTLGNNALKGNRLIADCISVLVAGSPATNATTGETAQIPTGSNAAACKANIHHGPGTPTTGLAPKPGTSTKALNESTVANRAAKR